MFKFFRQILFLFSPEKAHYLTLDFLSFILNIPGGKFLLSLAFPKPISQKVEVNGISFPNPVGLAAGFDKDGKYLKVWQALGFGFVEVGTVTPLAQEGNPKPRLFRLPEDKAIINRMGFNNMGLLQLQNQLKNRPEGLVVGGNIGKNKITPNAIAHEDYLKCFVELYASVDYFTVNISSPNTPGLRDLQTVESVSGILGPLVEHRKKLVEKGSTYKPIFLKLAPDMAEEDLIEIVKFVNDSEIEGLVMGNTTLQRNGLVSPNASETGGLSGKPLIGLSNTMLQICASNLAEHKTLIGVGGILCGKDAKTKKEIGAHLVQVYTGFIYEGPSLIHASCLEWNKN
jgi:dihydroorotate dehydrogenase